MTVIYAILPSTVSAVLLDADTVIINITPAAGVDYVTASARLTWRGVCEGVDAAVAV